MKNTIKNDIIIINNKTSIANENERITLLKN